MVWKYHLEFADVIRSNMSAAPGFHCTVNGDGLEAEVAAAVLTCLKQFAEAKDAGRD